MLLNDESSFNGALDDISIFNVSSLLYSHVMDTDLKLDRFKSLLNVILHLLMFPMETFMVQIPPPPHCNYRVVLITY